MKLLVFLAFHKLHKYKVENQVTGEANIKSGLPKIRMLVVASNFVEVAGVFLVLTDSANHYRLQGN